MFAIPKSSVSVRQLTDVVVDSLGLPGLTQLSSERAIFMNFESSIVQDWSYRGGSLVAGAAVSPDRRIYVAIAFGPGDDAQPTQIINSFSPLF